MTRALDATRPLPDMLIEFIGGSQRSEATDLTSRTMFLLGVSCAIQRLAYLLERDGVLKIGSAIATMLDEAADLADAVENGLFDQVGTPDAAAAINKARAP
jgi:hypothetical protein